MLKEQLLKIKEQLGFNSNDSESGSAKEDTLNKNNSNKNNKTLKLRRGSSSTESKKPSRVKPKDGTRKSKKRSKNDDYQLKGKRETVKLNKRKKRKKIIKQQEAPLVLISDFISSEKKTPLKVAENLKPKYLIPKNFVSERKGLWDFGRKPEDTTLIFDINSNEQLPEKDLVIGLDFGTAYTKVVIADETYAYPVMFEEAGYLLPSELYITKDGTLTLNKQKSALVFTKLKHPLLFGNYTEDDNIVIIAFLSLVFKSSRNWVATSPFRSHNVNWLLNAGLATDSYHNITLKEKFGALVDLAWNVSYLDRITPTIIKTLIKDSTQLTNKLEQLHLTLPHDCLSVFPEYVAQISGYMNSPSKRNYSHLLIDVGAGTLDIVMFTTKSIDGEWRYSTNAKNISNLGADILKAHREQYLTDKNSSLDSLLKNVEVANKLSISLDELNSLDSEFAKAINLRLRGVIGKVAGGYKFAAQITTFICGGGREIEFYQKQLDILKNHPIDLIDLPPPNRFQPPKDFEVEMFHRFSVALGLSYDPYNIGECEVNNVEAKIPTSKYSPSEYILSSK